MRTLNLRVLLPPRGLDSLKGQRKLRRKDEGLVGWRGGGRREKETNLETCLK